MKKLWILSVAVLISSNLMAAEPQVDPTTGVHAQDPTVTAQPAAPGNYPVDSNAAAQAEVASLIQKANACILERESKKARR